MSMIVLQYYLCNYMKDPHEPMSNYLIMSVIVRLFILLKENKTLGIIILNDAWEMLIFI